MSGPCGRVRDGGRKLEGGAGQGCGVAASAHVVKGCACSLRKIQIKHLSSKQASPPPVQRRAALRASAGAGRQQTGDSHHDTGCEDPEPLPLQLEGGRG